MKLTIERAALLKSLTHVQSVVERRNTIPILSNVLIEADGEALSLTATDMDLTVIDRLQATVGQSGSTTAPAHTLYRSEEHTSELQSLMRISYAVFCLKKKKKNQAINHPKIHSNKAHY